MDNINSDVFLDYDLQNEILDPMTSNHRIPSVDEDMNDDTAILETYSMLTDLNAPKTYQYSNSTTLLDYKDKTFWAKCFPSLFPYGLGGLDTKRYIQISLAEWIRHLLKLSSCAFVKHPTFLLVAFDVLSRSKMENAKFLTTKLTKQLIPSIGFSFIIINMILETIEPFQIPLYYNYLGKRKRAALNHQPLPVMPPHLANTNLFHNALTKSNILFLNNSYFLLSVQ
jgi:hypothetical protein